MPKLLEGRVAVVTGAGRGIGRAHALALARQGARVVVNDLGGATDGTGASRTSADEVVEEIRKAGGMAVASYDSVATSDGAQRMVNAAIDSFGHIDILVNNAGIFRDRMIFNMTDEEWDLVIKVHLYGTFYCTRAACRPMREQRYGRIINTASTSGMGSIGQVNYCAAKEGIVGFTRAVAKDLGKYGVTCHAIRPRAATRLNLTEDLYEARRASLGEEKAKEWRESLEACQAGDVSPLVVYLASPQASNINGCIFDVFHNYIAIYDDPPRLRRTMVKREGRWLPEELVELVPNTLALGLEQQPLIPLRRLTPDARGWEWAEGVLKEVSPTL